MHHSTHASPSVPLDPYIGRPVSFLAGHFAGRTLRAELYELQAATAGRKCGTKDRRPLDPPPVVSLRLFEVRDAGTPLQAEWELGNLSEVDNHGFLCHVDLFHVQDPASSPPDAWRSDATAGPSAFMYGAPGHSAPDISTSYHARPSAGPFPGYSDETTYRASPRNVNSHRDPAMAFSSAAGFAGSDATHHAAVTGGGISSYYPPIAGLEPLRTIEPQAPATNDDELCTRLFAGTTIVASSCITHGGKNSMLFTFSDLAIEAEGLFFLRYRAFNILNVAAGAAPIPVLAECYGSAFRVYNTKDFPGLRASTDLTKVAIIVYGSQGAFACKRAEATEDLIRKG
ncbi:velvet factor [Rhodofomes roseus]|uniref:Velvet factor n=1 Tax=Rhodofomes roseus TaxID=34475 RepID=A0ABQ8K020_9APHY|nr:velvet factor [Rhodofomes roseus]KAH9829985.1 velvet factor [Rhodofomes roseus]